MTKSLQTYTSQMNQLLEELIQVATKMRDISRQVISEEELNHSQKRQQEILKELEEVDLIIQEQFLHLIESKAKQHFSNLLQTFQLLNQEFIQNLNESHGLIQFEFSHLRETEREAFSIDQVFLKKESFESSVKSKKNKKTKR